MYTADIFLTRSGVSAHCCTHLSLTCSYAHGGNQRSVIVEFHRAEVDAGSIVARQSYGVGKEPSHSPFHSSSLAIGN